MSPRKVTSKMFFSAYFSSPHTDLSLQFHHPTTLMSRSLQGSPLKHFPSRLAVYTFEACSHPFLFKDCLDHICRVRISKNR